MITEILHANSTILRGRLVSLSLVNPGYVDHTNWRDFKSTAGAIGIAIADTNEGEPCEVCIYGIFENTDWTFTPNMPVYSFDQGTLTQMIPPINIFDIGLAVTQTKLFVNIPKFIMGH
jgi:hypothetical protein